MFFLKRVREVLSSAPAELSLQDVIIALAGDFHHVHGVCCFLNQNGIAVGDMEPYLTVKSQKDIGVTLVHVDLDRGIIWKNQGAINQGKRANRGKNDSL